MLRLLKNMIEDYRNAPFVFRREVVSCLYQIALCAYLGGFAYIAIESYTLHGQEYDIAFWRNIKLLCMLYAPLPIARLVGLMLPRKKGGSDEAIN